jgi:hypothetical protein
VLTGPDYPGWPLIQDGNGVWQGPRNYILLYDEFIGGVMESVLGWANISVGTAASWGVNTVPQLDLGHPGVGILDTGTQNTGYGSVTLSASGGTAADQFAYSAGRLVQEWLVNLDYLSTNASDAYTLRVGFTDQSNADPIDGAIFRYTDNVNSGNWQCFAQNGGAGGISFNTSVAVTASPTGTAWTRLRIDGDAAGANVIYSIQDVPVWTNNTASTIFKTLARTSSPGANIVKSAGTNSRKCYVDYFWLYFKPTVAR